MNLSSLYLLATGNRSYDFITDFGHLYLDSEEAIKSKLQWNQPILRALKSSDDDSMKRSDL